MDERPPTRLAWIDAARALCVFGIVLMHFWIWVYSPTVERYADELVGWSAITDVLLAFRMPLLFMISGLLVSVRVRNGWADRRNLLRAGSSYYLYAVWLTVYAALSFVLVEPLPNSIHSVDWYLRQLLIPETPLWFVFFLAVNVVVLTTLNRVHPAVVLLALFGVSLWSLWTDYPAMLQLTGRGLYYMLFFAIGVYMRSSVLRLATVGLWWKLVVSAIAYIWSAGLFWRLEYLSFEWLTTYVVRDVSAAALGVCVVAAVCRLRPLARILGFIGRRTLAVYVLQVPLIWAGILLLQLLPNDTVDNAPMRLLAPGVATIAIVVAAIVIASLLQRLSWGRLLFEPPSSVKQLLLRDARQ